MGFLSAVPSDSKVNAQHPIGHENFLSTTVYGSVIAAETIPRFELSEGEMPARVAMRMVYDELLMVNLELSCCHY